MIRLALLLTAALVSTEAFAASLVAQWKQGLAGSRLTSYSGSVLSSNSTLTVIDFCRNGRYQYYREGSWSAPGGVGEPSVAGGASNNTIRGRWGIRQQGYQVFLTYLTDQGQRGAFPISLEYNGRVNIGGASYAVERNRSGC